MLWVMIFLMNHFLFPFSGFKSFTSAHTTAICAQPPGTVSGKFRITEQGEIITQNYAHIANAEKHLNTYAAALLYEKFLPYESRAPTSEYRTLMDAMSETSCEAYRDIVRGRESFVPYFRAATPEVEIASLNVGSRPAKRRPTGGVETLRAIPWVFAWTQTRLNLTAWLGIGSALSALGDDQKGLLKSMFKSWPWFTALVRPANVLSSHFFEFCVHQGLSINALILRRSVLALFAG